jgi:hypothetical protein
MLATLRPRSVYDVLAAIGCFVALSTGGAYASHLVVDSSDVLDDSLTGTDVKGKPRTSTTPAVNGSLTTDDIAGQQANAATGTPFIDGTLTQWDIKNGSVTGADLASNTVGAADIATDGVGAAEIAADAVGGAELRSFQIVSDITSVPPSGGVGQALAYCPFGTRLISGGAGFTFPSGDISASESTGGHTGWLAEGQNNGTVAQYLTVHAYCLGTGQ